MTVKLKEIGSVQMGHSFRSRLEPEPNGKVAVIQMKDLTEDNRLNTKELARVELKNIKSHHLVKQNDLTFRSRGQTNTAALMDADFGTAVIASPLLRVRVNDKAVLAEYLCWFINQPSSQAVLQSKAAGTAIKMIGKPTLEDLEVVIPSLRVQKKIIALDRLSVNEQKLMKTLARKKEMVMKGILMRLASNIQ